MTTCPRCERELSPHLDYGHRHVCENPWVYTAVGEEAFFPTGKRAVRIEYCVVDGRPLPVPIDTGAAPADSVLGQPPAEAAR